MLNMKNFTSDRMVSDSSLNINTLSFTNNWKFKCLDILISCSSRLKKTEILKFFINLKIYYYRFEVNDTKFQIVKINS